MSCHSYRIALHAFVVNDLCQKHGSMHGRGCPVLLTPPPPPPPPPGVYIIFGQGAGSDVASRSYPAPHAARLYTCRQDRLRQTSSA